MKFAERTGVWLRAHLWKTDFRAVGKTENDVKDAYKQALDSDEIVDKRWGLPIFERAGLSINESSLQALKVNEIAAKLSTVIPAVAGLVFLSESWNILRTAGLNNPDSMVGGLMGVIGLAAVTFGQMLTWKTGEIYGRMYDWAKENRIEKPYIGKQYWPGNGNR